MHLSFLFNLNLKNLKSFCGKKDVFDCAGIQAQVFRYRPIERPGLESPCSRKRLLFHRKISNSLNLNLICIYLRYKSLKLSTRTPVGNVPYLMKNSKIVDEIFFAYSTHNCQKNLDDFYMGHSM